MVPAVCKDACKGIDPRGKTLLFPGWFCSFVAVWVPAEEQGPHGSSGCITDVLQGLPGCVSPVQVKKYSPNITTGLHGWPRSSGVLRHLHIWGRGSHSQEAPSNTNTGNGDGRQRTRRPSTFTTQIPTETKPLFLKQQSWGYFSFAGFWPFYTFHCP